MPARGYCSSTPTPLPRAGSTFVSHLFANVQAMELLVMLIVVGGIVGVGWFIWQLFADSSSAPSTPPPQRRVSATASEPKASGPKKTALQLARQIRRDHPHGMDTHDFVDLCYAHGLEPQDVDRKIDQLVADAHVKPERVNDDGLNIIDLTWLEPTRLRVRGTANYIRDSQRAKLIATQWLLIREPENVHDANAVAVHALDGRKVGFVSAKRAALMAPLLDQLDGGAYLVGGSGAKPETIALHVDLPRIGELRAFAAAS